MKEPLVFDGRWLSDAFEKDFPGQPDKALYVAYSGGPDSTALLHALTQGHAFAGRELTALHANHGLNPEADGWEIACRRFCSDIGVRFISTRLQVGQGSGYGLEDAARQARYAWFEALMHPDALLLTAHHRGDQTETVLANLLRGSGVGGLRGMPRHRRLGQGTLWRPLLEVPGASLRAYQEAQGLGSVEDPMNHDTRYSRAFLRSSVLPVLRERWPAVEALVARSAENVRDAAAVLEEVGREDLARLHTFSEYDDHAVEVEGLGKMSAVRCANVLRLWMSESGFTTADRYHLLMICERMLNEPTSMVVRWPGAQIRRYGDYLYLSDPRVGHRVPDLSVHLGVDSRIGLGNNVLIATEAVGHGLRRDAVEGEQVHIRARRGGERCRLPGRSHSTSLKKLLQQHRIPPWRRDRLPLVYIDDRLAAVVGLCYCEPFLAAADQAGVELTLSRNPEQ